MDNIDRKIINELQGGFPVSERPFLDVGTRLGISEDQLIERLENLTTRGVLSRFGPMYHAERLGGAFTLAAMRIASEDFERVTEQVNAFPEVAHNYARNHEFNMWFVLATETPDEIGTVLAAIEQRTGYRVHNFPKIREYFVGLRLEA